MGCLLSPESSDLDLYRETVLKTADAIIASINDGKAYAGPEPRALNKIISSYEILPQHGSGFDSVLADLKKDVLPNFLRTFSTEYMAHLHSAALLESLAAELIISSFNQSMDSWDQSPVATEVEEAVTKFLASLYGLADGAFTSGGSQSNLTGILLARDWYCKEKDIVSGVVQRYVNHNYYIDLGKIDAVLTENEQVKTEKFRPTERIRLYVLEVKDTNRGPRITVSRTHPELVKRLFESEVAEVKDGTVEIRAIAREAGSRTKIAVSSNEPNVDPVGACVGINGARVNAVVQELRGEKIDIINWDDNPAFLIENALSPAKVILVAADEDAKEAEVIVPDHQLSLAIGKEGQNARLAARLTGYRIDIKSETEARESGLLDELEMGYQDGFEGYTDEPLYGGDADMEPAEYPEEMPEETEEMQ